MVSSTLHLEGLRREKHEDRRRNITAVLIINARTTIACLPGIMVSRSTGDPERFSPALPQWEVSIADKLKAVPER